MVVAVWEKLGAVSELTAVVLDEYQQQSARREPRSLSSEFSLVIGY